MAKITDKFGTVFDPAVHQMVKGKPHLRKDGSFVPLKGKKNLSPASELPPPRKKRATIAPKGVEIAQPSGESPQKSPEIAGTNGGNIAPNAPAAPGNLAGETNSPPIEISPPAPPANTLQNLPAITVNLPKPGEALPPAIFEDSKALAGTGEIKLEMPKADKSPEPVNSAGTGNAPEETPQPEKRADLAGTIGADDIPDSGEMVDQIQGMLASDAFCEVLEMLNVHMFGEGMRMKPIEKEKINNGTKRLLGNKNVVVPPWLDVTICLGTYYFVRITYMKQVAKTRLAEKEADEAKAKAAKAQKEAEEAAKARVNTGAAGAVTFSPAGL